MSDTSLKNSLINFIKAANRAGASDDMIVKMLSEAGWPDKKIYEAFTTLYTEKSKTEIPPPPGGRGEAARDAFLYLLSFVTLGIWAGAMGSLIFELINRAFPDPAAYDMMGGSISVEMSSIIIALPIYLWVTSLIEKDVKAKPEKLDSGVRKWLTYLILLVTVGFLIGDLITFLTSLFEGELSVRFVLKVMTVLAIAGGVFSYYFLAMKRKYYVD